jgi:uncharacterized protein YndB with AHSA1/START domain
MEVTTSVDIDRPAEEVFRAWSELERIPEWFVDSLERRKLTAGSVGVGTKYHAVDKVPPGRQLEGTLEITRYEPPRLIAASLSDPFNAIWEATFDATDGGTRMRMHTDAHLAGIQRLLAPFLTGWARRVQQRGLDAFKSSVEGCRDQVGPR